MAEPTATNPQTGERIVFRGGSWVPLDGAAPVAAPQAPGIIRGRPDPQAAFRDEDQQFQRNSEARAAADQALQIQQARQSAEAANRSRLEWEATHNPDGSPKARGGKSLADGATKRIESGVGQYTALSGALGGFKDDYAGNTLTGNAENVLQGVNSSFGTEGQRNWWANFRSTDNVIRNELFGAALTPGEKAAYEATTIDPSLDPKIVRENLSKRTDILKNALDRQRRFMIANGYNSEAVDILYEPLRAMEQLNAEADGVTEAAPPPPGLGSSPPASSLDLGRVPGGGSPVSPQLAQGNEESLESPTTAGLKDEYRQRLESGQSGEELASWLESVGVTDADTLRSAHQQADYRKRYPNVPISNYPVTSFSDSDLSVGESLINSAAQSSLGTAAINAGNVISGNNLDTIIGVTGGNSERARAGIEELNERNPGSAFAGQIVGATGLALGGEAALARAGIAAGVGRTTSANALAGGFEGFGAADGGSIGNRFLGAAQQGGINALAGLAATGVYRGVSSAVTPVARAANRAAGRDPNVAIDQVSRSLAEDGISPRQAAARVGAARERGVPMSIADTGENSRELLASVGRARGESRNIARTVTQNRQADAVNRISDAVRRDLGPTANIREMGDELMGRAKDESTPFYRAAYAAPGADAAYPKVRALLERPSAGAAMARARRIAAEEGRNPDELGLVMDANGAVSFHPPAVALQQQVTRAREALAAAQRRGSGSAMGSNNREIAAAQEALASAEQNLARAPSGTQTMTTPSWETLHYIKTGLDDVIEKYRDPVTGKLNLDAEGRLINNTKNRLLAIMDEGNPSYKEARALYAGPASMRDALELGSQALRKAPDDVAANIKNMGPSEKAMYQMGLRKAMVDMLGSKGDYADKVKALIGTPKSRQVLQKVLGGREEYDRFIATLEDERALGQTYQAVNGNSATAGRLAFDETTQGENIASQAIDTLRAGQTGGFGGMLSNLAEKVIKAGQLGPGAVGDRARADISRLLTETDPRALDDLAKLMRRAAAQKKIDARAARIRSNRAGTFSGTTAGALGLGTSPDQ